MDGWHHHQLVQDSPRWLERVAYRCLGVRLDERWRAWVTEDLADPRWVWRHCLAQLLTLAAVVALVFAATGQSPWPFFVGVLLGQLASVRGRDSTCVGYSYRLMVPECRDRFRSRTVLYWH